MIDLQWRFERIGASGLDAVVCALPHHVLMLTGYRPRLGTGIALAPAGGSVALALPSDEVELARAAGLSNLIAIESSTLERAVPLSDAIAGALRELGAGLQPRARVGFEDGPLMTPNAYVSTLQLGGSLTEVLGAGLPGAELVPASALLRELDGRKTPRELDLLRAACSLGEVAFAAARAAIAPGRREFEVAGAAVAALAGSDPALGPSLFDMAQLSTEDFGGGAWVMSGPNSALAYRAFAATGGRRIERGDLVLVHMNPEVHGIWSDLTRTFVVGEPRRAELEMLQAMLEARGATRPALRPGAEARAVDAIARRVLAGRGYGSAFKHQLGHGIGFNGISGLDAPSLHPLSQDLLESGMCFNLEPAVYIDGVGGCRHCDALVLDDDGPAELSPYLATLDDLIIGV